MEHVYGTLNGFILFQIMYEEIKSTETQLGAVYNYCFIEFIGINPTRKFVIIFLSYFMVPGF